MDAMMIQNLLNPENTSMFATLLAGKAAPPVIDPSSGFNTGIQNNLGFMLTPPPGGGMPQGASPMTPPSAGMPQAQMDNVTGPLAGGVAQPAMVPPGTPAAPPTAGAGMPGLSGDQMAKLMQLSQAQPQQQPHVSAPSPLAGHSIANMQQLQAPTVPTNRPTLAQLLYGSGR